MSIKISELPVASAIGNNDIIPIVQESTTKSIKYEKLKPTIETTIDSSSTNDNPVGAKAVYDYSAPIGHASESTTYGQGTETKYGHCKTINNVTSASYVAGESLSAYQGKVLKGEIDTANANLQELIDETLPELLGNKEDKSNKTNTLDENSTAEQYPTAQVTFEKYSELLDQIPTATATGNPINVQDSSNLPLKEVDILGNATQVTTTGKNLIPFTIQDFTLNNIRYYVQNGSLYLNGTSTSETSSSSQDFKDNFSFTLSAGTYTLSRTTPTSLPVYLKKYSDNSALISLSSSSTLSDTVTLNEETQVYVGFYVYNKSYSNEMAKIMLSKSDGDYEPYTRTEKLRLPLTFLKMLM